MNVFSWLRLLFLLFALGGFLPSLHAQAPLQIELIVPVSEPDGTREISLDRYRRLHVRLFNPGPQPALLWKDWNSWGYFNLQLFYRDSTGQVQAIRRLNPGQWDGDFPDFWTLPPGESVILEVDYSSPQWSGFPDLYGQRLPAELWAEYQNTPDELATEFGIWTGKLRSDTLRVVFE